MNIDSFDVSRPITIVRTYRKIGLHMKKPVHIIKRWIDEGAPIYFENDSPLTPITELSELWAWRQANTLKSKSQMPKQDNP